MAGSKPVLVRVNIHGHIVVTTKEAVVLIRRLSSMGLNQIFSHAKDQGSALISLGEEPWTLQRNSDHTFTLTPGHDLRPVV